MISLTHKTWRLHSKRQKYGYVHGRPFGLLNVANPTMNPTIPHIYIFWAYQFSNV